MSASISVIVPVYDHAAELVACLRSLQAQTRPPKEVIVVDDGSSDDPAGAVERSGLGACVTRWISLPSNQGAPVARNRGFEASSGDLVIFLDADAVLREDGLARLAAELAGDPGAAFAYSAFRFGGKLFRSRPFSPEALAEGNFIHTSALIRREAFPGFDESLKKFQDWDLWIRIAAAGGRGAYVPELLLSIKARAAKGMSRWLPSFAYGLPWRAFGFVPGPVRRFRAAQAVLEEKHRSWFSAMRGRVERPTLGIVGWAGVAFACLAVSVATLGTPVGGAFALAAGALVAVAAAWRPSFALAALAFELVLGSKGGWLKFGADAVNDGGIGVRILLFAGFFLGWGISLLRAGETRRLSNLVRAPWIRPYLVLAAALGWGVVRGAWLRQPFLVPDANAWGFLLLLVPAAALWEREPGRLGRELSAALRASLGLLTGLTLALFVLFSRTFSGFATLLDPAYAWVRRSGIGEITNAGYGVSRIFLISQIMLVAAWLWVLVRAQRDHLPLGGRIWGAWVALGAALIASFSRSFWMGLAVAALAATAFAVMDERGSAVTGERLRRWFGRPFLAVFGALAAVLLVASASSLASVLGARLSSGEAAAASRWSLLPVMREGIGRHPLLGSGFGATLTYETSDPRIVAKTGGRYTTYAFEWGWLDLWYKLGIFGVAALLAVLASLIVRARSLAPVDRAFVWAAVLALATVHVFTPYLNHPLGIGILVFLEGVVQVRRPASASRPG